jgi:hypothetical protein
MYVSSKIEEASARIQEMMEEKKRLMRSMQDCFFFGVVVILISQILNMLVG